LLLMAETANSVHWADLIKTKIHMLRLEDPPLLRGEGQFTDDVASAAEPALSMVILRSPVAHGVINKIDVSAALKMPGVATILTANDPHIAAMAPMRCRASVADTQMLEPDRPVLAATHVKHVGEAIAAIVADDIHQALDAAGAIVLDIDTLPAVTDVQTAVNADDPEHSLVWPDIPANRAFTWEKGNREETDARFAQAHHVARLTVKHPRICIAPVETRAVLASYDTAADSYTLTTASQGVISLQRALSGMMGIDPSRLRVITHDTGGSFAVKIWPYAEHLLALAAAKQTGRTVRWSATRSEAMVADVMGRGRVDQAELALDKDGRFLAFRIDALADMGAYLNAVAPAVATSGAVRVFGQAYRIAGLHYRVQALYTNTMTTDAYRGAGKPESSTTLERVIDVAAREMNIDPVQLRQQNLVTPADLPYHTPMKHTMVVTFLHWPRNWHARLIWQGYRNAVSKAGNRANTEVWRWRFICTRPAVQPMNAVKYAQCRTAQSECAPVFRTMVRVIVPRWLLLLQKRWRYRLNPLLWNRAIPSGWQKVEVPVVLT
jgi:carbon-monoxide dehydrogenase large subunit